ncbi:ABC transporter substrate-binding protein [Peloplasma aerotolerans]|uniref:Extracellular solute-binding protein n=1 Tax=Peloplasma aerotolerans TaxID=3044389 RepID=A0AAW6U4J9_9MOLU|nr:extracellular solute-binding protein [Mariniplasma sp. M4Ah]MDI6452812.1 extracellular solute-binding protein [Mariniplasma sp. M4Ah]
MKNTTKRLMIFILAFVSIFVLSACLNNSGTREADGRITVLLDNKDRAYFENIIERYETFYSEEGYTVNPIWTSGADLHSNQATRVGAGSPPDLLIGGDMYTELYSRSLYDLTPLIERDQDELDMEDFIDGIMDRLEDNSGRVVFMPKYFNISLLYYNKTLFDQSKDALLQAGLSEAPAGTLDAELHYPHINWNIDDYFKAAGILTKQNNNGDYTQWGSSMVGGWWGEWLIHLRQSGADIFNEDGYVDFNNEQGRNALQIWRDKAYGNQELGRPKISVSPGQTDFGGFQGLKVAMEYGGHTANWSRYDSLSSLNWGVTLLPTGLERRAGAEYAIEGVGIYKDTPNVEAAWAFVKFLTNKEGIKDSVEIGYLSVRESVLDEMEDGKLKVRTQLAIDAINPNGPYGNYAMTLPKFEYFSDITINVIEPILALMLANDGSRISIEEALDRIHKQANDYITLNYK